MKSVCQGTVEPPSRCLVIKLDPFWTLDRLLEVSAAMVGDIVGLMEAMATLGKAVAWG